MHVFGILWYITWYVITVQYLNKYNSIMSGVKAIIRNKYNSMISRAKAIIRTRRIKKFPEKKMPGTKNETWRKKNYISED